MANLYKIKDKTVLFIHIPKTGGRSLRKVLEKYEFKKYNLGGHPDYIQIKKIMGADFKSIDYIFSIVRNSFDWRNSWYFYVKNTAPKFTGHKFEHDQLQKLSFNEHISWLISIDKSKLTKSYYAKEPNNLFIKSQIDYLKDVDGSIKINKILQLNNITSDFNLLMNELGLNIKFNAHINKSSNKTNVINNCDEKTELLIKEMYKEDINFITNL